ncbi:MAG TPA: hypothetical protein VMI31_04270 [Fimbriimonadaceae bacterium]|nr:hypothetical protein [Fimbriimonadaceae bacterium]
MKRKLLYSLAAALSVSLAGCGGSLGHDSKVQVEMLTTGGTVDFTNLHVIISPNSGTATDTTAASDTQSQTWATVVSDTGLKELDFVTDSQQVPYFVYVQNNLGSNQEARVRIFMDGALRSDHIYTVAATTSTQENTIFRNNVQNQ